MAGSPVAGGILVVDKPAGWTSHDVVARVRRLAGTRRVGHAGTLDPMATGVLVLGIERGTKLLGHLAGTGKTYAATARLGVATSTDDADGAVVSRQSPEGIGQQEVRAAAARFVGVLDQIPSTVSAIKVDGQRAYARARRGEQVQLAPRAITIHALVVHDVRPAAEHIDVDLTVECSTGTYVRALARDLGTALGIGGHLTALRRTAVGPFGLATAQTLTDIERHGVRLVSLAEAAGAVFPTVVCDDDQARAVSYGQVLAPAPAALDGTMALVDSAGRLLALYERSGDGARAVSVFEPA